MTTQRTRAQARKMKQFEAKYDAAGNGRRVRSWSPPSTGPNRAIQGLQKIRDRARDSSRNDWAASSATQKWATTLIGVGITPRWDDDKITALWVEHVPDCDADGVLDAYGLQTLGARTWFDAGEVFLRRRPRALTSSLTAPVQYQLIEPEFCPLFDAETWPGMPAGNTIRQGIERNNYGERTAYWMYREHPGDNVGGTPNASSLIRVAASQISHIFEPKRPGQLRGVSEAAAVLVRLRSSMDFEDAVLDRQKLANLWVAFITRAIPDGADVEFDADTGLPKFYNDAGTPVRALEPGMTQELLPGEDVKFSNPSEAGTTFSEYMKTTHMGTSAGMNLPYELMSGDIANVSDRTLRVIIQEFRRLARSRQWQLIIPMLCQPMVDWWADALVMRGELSISKAAVARKPKWSPEGWEYIHPVQDVQGKIAAIDAGLISRDQVISERGDDPKVVDAERAAAQRRADDLGIKSPAPKTTGAPAPGEPTQKPQPKAEWHPEQVRAFTAQADLAVAQAAALQTPSVTLEQTNEPSFVDLVVAGFASMGTQVAGLATAITALAAKPTEIHTHVEPTPVEVTVEPPDVHIDNNVSVEPTPVTTHVDVAAPEVHVAAPIVNVEAPIVNVNPEIDVNLPERKTTSVIDRDRDGNITEVTQTETTVKH